MRHALMVGDFSKATHLSVKTLRHYHQVGLLRPAEVDPGTGYRYYTPDQIPTAQVIRRLRDLDMPITDVKAVLATPDARTRGALIAAHLDRLESELARTRSAVDSLRDLLRRPAAAPVEHRTIPACPAIGITAEVDRADLPAWWQGARGELHAAVQAQDLDPTGPGGGLYAGGIFQDDRGPATVFVPVAGHVRPIGRVEALVVPAAELAVTTHHGPLADADLAYGELGAYTARHEIGVAGPLREYYLRDARDTPDASRWVTEIGWPVFRADADDAADNDNSDADTATDTDADVGHGTGA
ncbi:MerR family transcriptional regulator [Streptomyces sp. SID3212]|uniref:MerR family transcriptional regulator n=1 Tax=Streptomyces sp. SID3212 TaxID=2690259 RepID=UPI001371FE6C|nr:MerR family transcriptional regulator [Streptomyces sp. SID3212]MYV52576.1 MerR family transcriptional regulator [Streptomyces sp. SID3212]